MEDKKVLKVVHVYGRYFKNQGILNIEHPHHEFAPDDSSLVLAHCHSMLNGIVEFISIGSQEKRDRALKRAGFVEGCLWTTRQYTVEEFKELNRPDKGTVNPQTQEPLTAYDLNDDGEY